MPSTHTLWEEWSCWQRMALEENLYAVSKMETQCIYFLVSIREIFKTMGISEKKKTQLSTNSPPLLSLLSLSGGLSIIVI